MILQEDITNNTSTNVAAEENTKQQVKFRSVVYQFGLCPPSSKADIVARQIRLAWEYKRDLLTLARARRAAERELVIDIDTSNVAVAKQQLNEALAACRKAKIKSGKRVAPKSLREAAKKAREAYKAEKSYLKDQRKAAKKSLKPKEDAIAQRWTDMRRSLRGHYSKALGLRHGTYTAVESEVEQACSDIPLWDDNGSPRDPSWPPFKKTGRVGVQIQNGISAAEFTDGSDTRLQLSLSLHRSGRTWPKYGTLRLRVGSNDDRTPMFAEWPIKLHRHLPENCQIKRAMVSYRREGPRDRWTCELTINIPVTAPAKGQAVAIDIGWRRVDEKLRVAAWRDESGHHDMLYLDEEIISAIQRPQYLRSIRDQNRDALLSKFVPWLRNQKSLPEWLLRKTVRRQEKLPSIAQAVAYIAQWKSQARLAHLARFWKKNRWPDDENGYDLLEAWRYRDHHLWEYESGQRAKSLRRRREHYRRFAAWLCETYGTVVLEHFDKRKVVTTPEHDELQTQQEERAQSWRVVASTSELIKSIRSAALSRGVQVVEVLAAWSTQDCPSCGYPQKWDAATSIERRPPCPACGCAADQDNGACIVLLNRWREVVSSGKNPVTTRKRKKHHNSGPEGETRWQRARRLKTERDARNKTSRNHEDNSS